MNCCEARLLAACLRIAENTRGENSPTCFSVAGAGDSFECMTDLQALAADDVGERKRDDAADEVDFEECEWLLLELGVRIPRVAECREFDDCLLAEQFIGEEIAATFSPFGVSNEAAFFLQLAELGESSIGDDVCGERSRRFSLPARLGVLPFSLRLSFCFILLSSASFFM